MNDTELLIVEDDDKIAALLQDYASASGFATRHVGRGDEVVAAVEGKMPDLVLLDLMLPGIDGLEVCRRLRAFCAVPIIMITARVEEIDRLLGLELGADDYLCKPFSPREVMARVKAVLRRTKGPLSRGSALELDAAGHTVRSGDTAINLTPTEYGLLATLMKSPGRIYSRAQLMDAAYSDYRIVSDRTIDAHVKNLRRKLSDAVPDRELVVSVYGVGYKFEG